jgi:hypothetical protein
LGKNILHSALKARLSVRTSREAGKRSGSKLSWLVTVDSEQFLLVGGFSCFCAMYYSII